MVESSKRLDKFLVRVNTLLDLLAREHENGLINKGVDRYYYIQKREELLLLREGFLDATRKTAGTDHRSRFFMEKLSQEYRVVYCSWKKDVRWINKVLLEKTAKNTRITQSLSVGDKA